MTIKNQRYKLVMFDMDGTLIKGRSIFIFAEKKGFKNKLIRSLQSAKEPYEKSIEIAQFLQGTSSAELLEIFRAIPLQKNVEKIARTLKEKNVKSIRRLRARQIGQKNWIDLEVIFAPEMKVSEVKIIVADLRKNIIDRSEKIADVVIISRASEPELKETN